MRKFFSFVLTLTVLISALFTGVVYAEEVPPLETPAPARIHEEPEPTEVPPDIINRTKVPDPLEGFRFKLDSKMLHIWFPNIQDSDEVVILYDDNVWLIDCASAKYAPRGVDMMKRLGITKIDKLFFTHPHCKNDSPGLACAVSSGHYRSFSERVSVFEAGTGGQRSLVLHFCSGDTDLPVKVRSD